MTSVPGRNALELVDLGAQGADAGGDGARAHVVGLDDHGRHDALGREHGLDLVVGDDDRNVLRQLLDAAGDDLHLQRRDTPARRSSPPASRTDRPGRRMTRLGERSPEARLPGGPAPAPEQRDAALLDPVAEPGEHRRQHRQRGEHGDRDHDDRALGERDEGLVAADEHAGHRDDHRHAGDQHGATRGRGGGLRARSARCAPLRAPRARGGGRTASSRHRPRGRSAG